MKKKVLLSVLALVMALSCLLAACGKDKNAKTSGNPAYSDGSTPSFSISMKDTASGQTYSAACSYATEEKTEAYTTFFLPGGDYEVSVYEYADNGAYGDPLATVTYQNAIDASKRQSVRVTYLPDSKKIEVTVQKSTRDQ